MEGDQHPNDAEYIDATTTVTSKERDNETQQLNTTHDYQPRTLKPSSLISRRRRSLLAAYPFHKYDTRPALLLLANVPNIDRILMEILSYSGDNNDGNLEFCAFKFELDQRHEFVQSFLIDFYQKLYIDTSRRWKINLSLIDYNLTRLHKCMEKYSKQVGEAAIASLDELPVALEFYLQIDVDLFFMKTCDFRDAEPRLFGKQKEKEGLFCQAEPYARYGMTPCGSKKCFLNTSETIKTKRRNQLNDSSAVVQFSEKQIHRFVNSYQAILNCPANCDTSNIIYALSCPCGEYDYIGSTAKTFHDRISEHREEGHRIIREFLIGSKNMSYILNQDKRKVEPLVNKYDQLLYQHSARCRYGLQRFLDKNPTYWCFIPQLSRHVKLDNEAYFASKTKNQNNYATTMHPFADITVIAEHANSSTSQQQQQQQRTESEILPLNASGKPMFFAAIVADMTRKKDEVQQLLRDVPNGPMDYEFSIRQREEQFQFFQAKKENCVFASDYVDLYNYSIVAVLPFDCSRCLREFIEALFVTHAETKLNLIGRLTHENPAGSFDSSIHGQWCAKLVHPLFDNEEIECL